MFSYDAAYDLPPHVQQTENLDDVTLDQELGRAYIIARGARGVYTVFFQDAGGDVVSAAPIFLAAQAGLQGVASLEVSSSALSAFLPILSALPALKQLGVYIEARAPDDDAPHALPSDALFTLPRAVKA